MKESDLSAVEAIEARCTKCRKITDHSILLQTGASPERLECKTCGRQHKPRPEAGTRKPAGQRPVSRVEAERKTWDDLRLSLNSDQAADYSMTAACKVKTLIRHPVFGLGIVQRVVGPQKVAILFEDGFKTMRCK